GFQLPEYHKQSGYHQFPDNVSPYKIPGDPSSGLVWGISKDAPSSTGTGDKKIQAYNFRVCLTDSAENRIPITRPKGYDSSKYELLLRLFAAQPTMRKINDYFIWSIMPHRKTDINNRGGFSTDMIGESYDWPEANYQERKRIFDAHLAYTKGLLYFLQNDSRVPQEIQTFIKNWGYPKDEYKQFGHFTPQLYVREARRMLGAYVMTEHNCRGSVTVNDGIGLAAYGMDSHNCQRIIVNGMVKNEGNVEVGGFKPYPISYRSITPKQNECTNLLVPVCLSATHIAYGSIRMEPVFMVLGQSAAEAASLAIDEKVPVQQINVSRLQQWLKNDPDMDHQLTEKP
ncbi:MAG: FAD-dependent oxidoreductase, partial [Ginsengibacter sp.]